MLIKLENYMLPCTSKQFFDIDCPGCGIQRSILHILKGDFVHALYQYPAIYTLILFGFLVFLNLIFKNKVNSKIIYSLGILNIIIIITNYLIKLLFKL